MSSGRGKVLEDWTYVRLINSAGRRVVQLMNGQVSSVSDRSSSPFWSFRYRGDTRDEALHAVLEICTCYGVFIYLFSPLVLGTPERYTGKCYYSETTLGSSANRFLKAANVGVLWKPKCPLILRGSTATCSPS